MKKMNITIILICFIVSNILQNCSISEKPETTQLNTVKVYLNGSRIKINTILYNEAIYVPINQVCYYFKCDYINDDEKKVINFIKNNKIKEKPESIDNKNNRKKRDIRIENSNYITMLDGILLFITPIVYDNMFYISLEYFAESFEKSTKWGLFKKSVKIKNYPKKYVGTVNGENINKRFFDERYFSKISRIQSESENQDNKTKITDDQKKQLQEEVFYEIVEMILAYQKASEYGIIMDKALKNHINNFLVMTINRFGGIDKFREKFKDKGITYQDAINYFAYGVIKEALIEKASEGVDPSEDMMRMYYDNSQKSFIKPAKAIVKHIIIPIKDKDENSFNDEKIEKQSKTANMILEKIKNGEDFEELRKKYSKDYYPDTKDNIIGFEVARGSLSIAKVFEDAVFSLKPGETSNVVKTYRGFHIIKLISKTQERQMTFEESKERIKRDLAYMVKINYIDESMKKWKEESVIEKHL